MMKVRTSQLRIGMVLAEPVFSPNGNVLLNEGSKLNEELINKLAEKEIFEVAVYEKNTALINPDDVLVNRVKIHAHSTLDASYPIDEASTQLNEIKQRHNRVSDMLDILINNSSIHSFFLDLRTIDDFTLEHCVNVCVLSLIVGATLNLGSNNLVQLGTGAILHDIGKKSVPQEIVKKEGELTPAETLKIQEHTKSGYQILRDHDFSPEIAKVVLYHHERWDGSGYPSKLQGDKVDLFSRIVAVADVYDALTGERPYRKKYLPHEAMEYLYGTGNFYFDAKVVNAFIKSIAAYPLGSLVQISTGEIGIVVNVEKTAAPRPIVKICYDKDNKKMEFPRQIDLSEEKTIFITKIL